MDVLDFQYYRDVLIDLWGQKGRLEVFQEGWKFVIQRWLSTGLLPVKWKSRPTTLLQWKQSCGLAYYEMYSNLADSIDGKANLFCPVEEALKAEVIVEAAFKSARQNGDIRSGVAGIRMTNFIAYVEDPGAANFLVGLKAVMTRAGHQLELYADGLPFVIWKRGVKHLQSGTRDKTAEQLLLGKSVLITGTKARTNIVLNWN